MDILKNLSLGAIVEDVDLIISILEENRYSTVMMITLKLTDHFNAWKLA